MFVEGQQTGYQGRGIQICGSFISPMKNFTNNLAGNSIYEIFTTTFMKHKLSVEKFPENSHKADFFT